MIPGDVRVLSDKDLFVSQGSLIGGVVPRREVPRCRQDIREFAD
jgi:hypothetical protein